MKTNVATTKDATLLTLGTADAFHAVWEALNQYVDNQEETWDEARDWDETTKKRVAEVRILIAGLDKVYARLAE